MTDQNTPPAPIAGDTGADSGPVASIKRTVRVTIEKEIEIELTPAVFGGMSIEAYLAEFRNSLWHVDTIDDVVKYAACLAATGGRGCHHDGLGLLDDIDIPRQPDVRFREIDENIETEVTQ